MPQQPSWVQHVMANYASTNPPPGIFTQPPEAIADAGDVKGVAPCGVASWQRMVNFHRNRSGKKLSDERREALNAAVLLLSQRIRERKALPDEYDPQTLLPLRRVKKAWLSQLVDSVLAMQPHA